MYNEKRENANFNFKSVILQFLFVALFIFILIWLFPMKSDLKKSTNLGGNKESEQTDLSMFYDQVFNNNVVAMKDAAKSYYTTERLPKTVGDSVKMTLGKMLDKKIILPFRDSKGKSCDLKESYVQITKNENEFVMKVNLKCTDQENYLLVYMGCYDYCQTAICEKNKSDIKTPVVYSSKPKEEPKPVVPNITNIVNNVTNNVTIVTNNTTNITVVTPEPEQPLQNKNYVCRYSKTTGGTTTYGDWSAWTTNEIIPTETLQVQRGKKDVTTTTTNKVITKDLTKPIIEKKTVATGKATVTYCAEYSITSVSYSGWERVGYVALTYIPNDTATTKYVPVSDTTWICKSQCTAGVDHVYIMYKRTATTDSNTKCTKTSTIRYLLTTDVDQTVGYEDKVTYENVNTTNPIYVYRSRLVTNTNGTTFYKWDTCGLANNEWNWTGEKREV